MSDIDAINYKRQRYCNLTGGATETVVPADPFLAHRASDHSFSADDALQPESSFFAAGSSCRHALRHGHLKMHILCSARLQRQPGSLASCKVCGDHARCDGAA